MTDTSASRPEGAPGQQAGRWVALVFAIAGLACIGYGLTGAADSLAFAARASWAEARVVRIDVVPTRRRGERHHAVMAFRTASGAPVEAAVHSANAWVRAVPGEPRRVRYDPARPTRVETDSLGLLLFGSLLALPFGGVLLGIAWLSTGRSGDADTAPWWPIAVPFGAWLVLTALFFAVNETAAAQAWLRGSVRAEARILDVGAVGPGRGAYRPLVAFTTADGREVRVRLDEQGTRPEPGRRVWVRYGPAEPDRAAEDRGAGHWLRAGIAWTLAALLSAGGAALLLASLRARRRSAGA